MMREIVQGVIYRKNNDFMEFLVIKRVPEDGGFWQAVTGGKDHGEDNIATLRRELREEVGIESALAISDCLDSYDWGDPNDGKYGRDYIYAVEVSTDTEVFLDGNEHTEHKWLELEEALNMLKHDGNKRSMRLVADYARQN